MLGLRASLPKMPSFRKRRPTSSSGSDLYAKRKRADASPERGQKRTATDSDSDVSGRLREDSPFPRKRIRNDISDDVSVGSPWQPDDDVTDGPPATSVRTEGEFMPGVSCRKGGYSYAPDSVFLNCHRKA